MQGRCALPQAARVAGGAAARLRGGELLQSARDVRSLGEGIAARLAGLPKPPLVGPLTTPGSAEIGVTALCDFQHCPMLFHWRYELGVPQQFLRGGETEAARRAATGTERSDDLQRAATGRERSGPTCPPRATSCRPLNSMDAATAGTVFHRCMELADFTAPVTPQGAGGLVDRVLAELELQEQADTEALAAELRDMLARLHDHGSARSCGPRGGSSGR